MHEQPEFIRLPIRCKTRTFPLSLDSFSLSRLDLSTLETKLTIADSLCNQPACVLITGGYGCIGAETAKWLIRNSDCLVTIASRRVSDARNQHVFGDIDHQRMRFVEVDVRDQAALEAIIANDKVSHVAHLAGLQTPDCNKNRDLGLQINVAGTQNLIEAIKSSGRVLQRFVFASSLAVYGPRSFYPAGKIPLDSLLQPVNVYGAWKMAGEHVARVFSKETDVPTISVRPAVLFGPGRDAGLTASPTTAMKHVASGLPFEIPYQNKQDYLYAPDVGAAVGNMLVEPFQGYGEFTLPSHTVTTAEIVAAMKEAAVDLSLADSFAITVGTKTVPFACDLDFSRFVQTFPKVPHTPLKKAVLESVKTFVEHVNQGRLTKQSLEQHTS